MTLANVSVLLLYALGTSLGQVLFKIAADRAKERAASGFLESLVADGYFILAVALYGALALVWVWILMRVPLSRAYPFLVLCFVFTPAFAALFFNETIDIRYLMGLVLILSGLGILVWKAN